MYISLELIWGLEEESPGAKSAQAKLIRAPLIESLKRSVKSQLLRIKADENSVKGSLFLAALVAQIEAMERGENDEGEESEEEVEDENGVVQKKPKKRVRTFHIKLLAVVHLAFVCIFRIGVSESSA